MARTIIDAARAILSYLPEVAGDAAPEVTQQLEELLTLEDSSELRAMLSSVLVSHEGVAEWIARYVEYGAPSKPTVVADTAVSLELTTTVPIESVAIAEFRGDLEPAGVQLNVTQSARSPTRGADLPLLALQMGPPALAVLEGASGGALWDLIKTSFARFVLRQGRADQIRIIVQVTERPDRTSFSFKGSGPPERMAKLLRNIRLDDVRRAKRIIEHH
jgi:hypothetical protein